MSELKQKQREIHEGVVVAVRGLMRASKSSPTQMQAHYYKSLAVGLASHELLLREVHEDLASLQAESSQAY